MELQVNSSHRRAINAVIFSVAHRLTFLAVPQTPPAFPPRPPHFPLAPTCALVATLVSAHSAPMARYDVFLSYSRVDTERVAPLRDALRQLGYRVFLDTQSIDPGEQWKQRLERSIQASRTLVLCWSQNTRGSEYITFEYSRAEALHRRVLPWLLDKTPLPAMLEIQGVTASDAAQAAALLKPALGMPLAHRRKLQGAFAVVAAILAGFAAWYFLKPPPPPPPWKFWGQVTDRNTTKPIPNVTVQVFDQNGAPEKSTTTDAQGDFELYLPPPQPPSIHVLFRKDGYAPEQPLFAAAGKFWNMDMAACSKTNPC